MADEVPGDPSDAIFAVVQDYTELMLSQNFITTARLMTRLQDSISDLMTFHPDYSYSTGEIEGMFE